MFRGFADKAYSNAYRSGGGYNNAKKVWDKKVSSYGKSGYDIKSEFASGRGFFGNNLEATSLFGALKLKNIDLSSVDFKRGDIPKKSTDEKLTDPRYQCFFLVEKNGKQQVYAPGLNDKEASILSDDNKTYKYISYAKIKPYIKDFCYIDLTEKPRTYEIHANKPKPDSSFVRNTDKNLNKFNPLDYRPIDKSGYRQDPDKYKKALSDKKAQNYEQILQGMRDELIEAKKSIQNVSMVTDALNFDSVDFVRSNYSLLSYALDDYNSIIQSIEKFNNALDRGLITKDECKKQIVSLFSQDGNDHLYSRFKVRMSELNERIDDYKPSYLDW